MKLTTLLHNRVHRLMLPAVAALLLVSAGCASKGFVHGEIDTTKKRIGDVEGQVEANQDRIGKQGRELKRHGKNLSKVEGRAIAASKTAQDALDRAVAAGKLAEGKFLFESVLSDDKVRFGFDKTDLGEDANNALATFAEQLKAANENVYLEIQGHTDNTGPDEYNLKLGESRAEAVRLALNKDHGVALHRMAIISYGESEPVDDNSTSEGRARNRRVVLVVLK